MLFHKIKDLPDFWGLGTILHEAFDVITENISQRGLLDSMSQMFLMRCISVYIRLAMHRQIEVNVLMKHFDYIILHVYSSVD